MFMRILHLTSQSAKLMCVLARGLVALTRLLVSAIRSDATPSVRGALNLGVESV
jgi:hypothetical protein